MKITKKRINEIIVEELEKRLYEAENEEPDLLDPATDEFDELMKTDLSIQSDIDAVFSRVADICAFSADSIEDGLGESLYEIHANLLDEFELIGIPREDGEEIIGNKDHKIFWENILKVATLRIKEY